MKHAGSLATPRATLTHLSCSPNFPRASYLDERTADERTATPRATLTHLSCYPNFPSASYLDEHTAGV